MEDLSEKKRKLNQKVTSLIEDTLNDTYTDILDIFSAKIELAKLELSEQLAEILAKVIVLLVFIIACLYLISAIGILIGDLTGYPWLGYFSISALFFIVITVLIKFKPDYLTEKIQYFLYRYKSPE
jgi:uncharacterized membrane protein YqjE